MLSGGRLIRAYDVIGLKVLGRANTIDDRRFGNYIPKDPYLLVYKRNLIETVANNIRQKAGLDIWIRVSNVCNLNLGIDFLDLDDFWKEAIKQSAEEMIKEQNDASKDMLRSLESKIEAEKPHKSAFDSIPRPNFPH
jgi:hypothetical protein